MKKQILLLGALLAVAVIGVISYTLFKTPEAASPAANTAAVVADPSQVMAGDNGTVYVIDPNNSEARFIIEEVLRNVNTTVVGTTNQVSGQIVLNSDDVESAVLSEIFINARTLVTDNNLRNRALNNQILQTARYENISFVPTRLIGLPDSIVVGQRYDFHIEGDLTIIGQRRKVTFDTEASLTAANEISGLATTTLEYDDFGITIPFATAVQAVAEDVTLEFEFTAKAE